MKVSKYLINHEVIPLFILEYVHNSNDLERGNKPVLTIDHESNDIYYKEYNEYLKQLQEEEDRR